MVRKLGAGRENGGEVRREPGLPLRDEGVIEPGGGNERRRYDAFGREREGIAQRMVQVCELGRLRSRTGCARRLGPTSE